MDLPIRSPHRVRTASATQIFFFGELCGGALRVQIMLRRGGRPTTRAVLNAMVRARRPVRRGRAGFSPRNRVTVRARKTSGSGLFVLAAPSCW